MPAPSISIVTPCLNGSAYIRQTLDSVLSQKGHFDLQLLVIDGGSTDGTIDVLRSISDSRLEWISETDRGQTSAINKGLAMANGDIVAWLNCDDLYVPGALAAVAKAFGQNSSAQWLIGRCNIIGTDGVVARAGITEYKNRRLRSYSYKTLLRMNYISQPAVFWRRSFGASIGALDESLYWTMDYDLWLRMAQKSTPLLLDQTLASFRVHRSSKSRGGYRPQFAEGYRVACRYTQRDRFSRWVHRFNIEKIVWGYRALRIFGGGFP